MFRSVDMCELYALHQPRNVVFFATCSLRIFTAVWWLLILLSFLLDKLTQTQHFFMLSNFAHSWVEAVLVPDFWVDVSDFFSCPVFIVAIGSWVELYIVFFLSSLPLIFCNSLACSPWTVSLRCWILFLPLNMTILHSFWNSSPPNYQCLVLIFMQS